MTSRHCFFRELREDLRHKVWMLALSTVGSLLTVPVAYLLLIGSRQNIPADTSDMAAGMVLMQNAHVIEGFFGATLCLTAGATAVLGACIVGLFGFRYVFQRNMTDLYHSLPVRRKTQFFMGWLSGFLIWFVPYLVNLAVTLFLGVCRLGMLKSQASQLEIEVQWQWPTATGILINALISTLAVMTAFLLVYHLVLLAVMLCGNLLNTLTVSVTLGAGAALVWWIITMFRYSYLDTYLKPWNMEFRWIAYVSPFVSAVCVLYQRVQEFLDLYAFSCQRILINLVIAAALWLLAFAAYKRRKSELAEQGVTIKPVRFLVQITVSAAASLGGWLMFWSMAASGGMRLLWSSFGLLLAGGITFGVLDVIFNMDFKAFFSHKKSMAAVLFFSLLTGFTFRFDWLGYDEYLPKEEEIAEIAIYAYNISNSNTWSDDLSDSGHALNQVHIRDSKAAYAFLQSAVAAQAGVPAKSRETGEDDYRCAFINTKVTLENGLSYYREYRIYRYDCMPAYELVMRPEYLNVNYRLSDEDRAGITKMSLWRGYMAYEVTTDTKEGRERINAICDAYNRDLEETPEAVVRGDGRLMVRINLSGRKKDNQLEVYEEMHHTLEALRQAGLAYYADATDVEAIDTILLGSNIWKRDVNEETDILESVRELYGVTATAETASGEETAPGDRVIAETYQAGEETLSLAVTDPEEIKELLDLISYNTRRLDSIFVEQSQVVGVVTVLEKNGNQYVVSIPKGALPEKYLLRFEKVKEKLLQQTEWWNR